MTRRTKLKATLWLTVFGGVSLSIFLWITWKKVVESVGETTAWIASGGIILILILLGKFSINRIAKKFV